MPPAPWQRNDLLDLVFGAVIHSSFSAVVVAFLLVVDVVYFGVVVVWVLVVVCVHRGVGQLEKVQERKALTQHRWQLEAILPLRVASASSAPTIQPVRD